MMKIGHIELFVKEPLASLPFYRDLLGFEVVAIQADQFVWLRLGEQELLLRPGRVASAPHTHTYEDSQVALVLYTNNLPQTVATLEKRGLAVACMPNEPSCYVFSDPDGHWFQLVDPTHH